jgi:hypothetical protein
MTRSRRLRTNIAWRSADSGCAAADPVDESPELSGGSSDGTG